MVGLSLLIGPMFSGKSTNLIAHAQKFRVAGKTTLIIKHNIDNRYTSDPMIINHDGFVFKSDNDKIKIISESTLGDISEELLIHFDCLLIEEGQFFPDLVQFVKQYINTKVIIVAGLLGDYKLEPFENILSLLTIADSIHTLTANCTTCGAETSFTARTVESESQILVGTDNIYQPRCRKHHPYA